MTVYIEYRQLLVADLRHLTALIRLYEDVFKMEDFTLPDPAYVQSLLEKENLLFFVALLNDSVVGGLTAHVLPSTYFTTGEVYIYDLAVAVAWQRRGVGRKLIGILKEYCSARGVREIYVQADLEDDHAIDFYHATGGMPERVIHFTYPL